MKGKLRKDLSQGNIFSDMSKVSKDFLWKNKHGLMLALSSIRYNINPRESASLSERLPCASTPNTMTNRGNSGVQNFSVRQPVGVLSKIQHNLVKEHRQ